MKTPTLTMDKAKDFENAIKELIPSYLPEWKPRDGEVGWAVAQSFFKISALIATRLNKVPEKLFLSYLDKLDISPKDPETAFTAVEFKLRKKGATSVRIPINSQVMSQSKEIYKTQTEFTAMNSELVSCYFVDKKRDIVFNIWEQLKNNNSSVLLDGQGNQNRHELYIQDDKLFCFKKAHGKKQKLTLRLPKHNSVTWLYWGLDKEGHERWIEFQKYMGKRHLYLKKKIPHPSVTKAINGKNGYWVKAIFPNDTQTTKDTFSIRLSSISGIDYAFTNDVPIDLETDSFYPFGEEPQLEDCWYLASNEAFSKSGHTITLFLNTIIDLLKEQKVTLSWEFNNGKSWQKLKENHKNNQISFTLPNDISLFKQNDIESYWIRVRIIAGGYSTTSINTATVTSTTTGNVTKFDISQNTLTTIYTAPKLSLEKITVKGLSSTFQHLITYNNHNYESHATFPNPIFKTLEAKARSLYLGFDKAFDAGLVSLFFIVAMRQIKVTRTIECFYQDDLSKKLKIEDATEGLQDSGTISFLAPEKQNKTTLFNTLAYWIKIEFSNFDKPILNRLPNNTFNIPIGDGDEGDVIQGIYLNTVWSKYSHGGEIGVNGKAKSIDKLITTIPNIKELSNPLPITGGSKKESSSELIRKAPAKIRHRNRGINKQDIESLVYEASRTVARVKLFFAMDKKGNYHSGGNTVVILPSLDEAMPKPSLVLRQQIETYLNARLSAVSSFQVLAPEYIRISIEATLYTKETSYADRIEAETMALLHAYLHPLKGKENQTGWDFGESISFSAVVALLEHVSFIDYIGDIQVIMQSNSDQKVLTDLESSSITIPPYALMASGTHKIKVKEAP